ncbi:hypothetical protein ACLKA7_004981 [Drosophila subpalustris]
MEASKQQKKSRFELCDNEERVKLIEDVQQILWDLTDKKQKSKARYKRRRSLALPYGGEARRIRSQSE